MSAFIKWPNGHTTRIGAYYNEKYFKERSKNRNKTIHIAERMFKFKE